MKKIYSLSLLLLTGFGFAQQSLPVYESFNYTAGTALNGQGTWSGTVATPDDATITAGSLSYTGLPASTGNSLTFAENGLDPQLTIVNQTVVGTTVYASFILNISSIPATLTDAAGTHFAGLGAGPSLFNSTVWFKKATDGIHFNLGINRATTVADTQWSPTDFNQNQNYLIVIGYTIDATNSTSKMWINPSSFGGAEPAATLTATVGTNRTNIDRVYFRQDAVIKTPTINVDELRLATTWADVTTTVNPLGVKQNAIAGLSIYPNPVVNGTLFIDTNANAEKKIVVYNVLGKQVLSTTTSGNSINVGNLNSGIYIVKVTEEGKTATRKLVIR